MPSSPSRAHAAATTTRWPRPRTSLFQRGLIPNGVA
jgi:hypothetical protein